MEYEGYLAEEIRKRLEELKNPGSTCAGGLAKKLPSIPGLHVEGVGRIGLPMFPEQAKALASVATQAPFGRGPQTLVDTNVRNTLQVEPSKIKITNPKWDSALQELTREIAVALGVRHPECVHTELYKMLLYPEGGFFTKHRDTEKHDGMFGTLVIQLPSEYEGGKFIVSHNGETKEFLMGTEAAAFGCHFVAHYADCEHEIKPITSGYRLALVYSLCLSDKYPKPTAACVSEEMQELKHLMDSLDDAKQIFIVPFEHKYTIASLSRLGARALKGKDKDKADAVYAAGDGEWDFILCKVIRTVEGVNEDYEEEWDDAGNPYFSSDECFDVDGKDARSSLQLMEKNLDLRPPSKGGNFLVSVESFDENKYFSESVSSNYQETGNEGATYDITYGLYVLIAFSQKKIGFCIA